MEQEQHRKQLRRFEVIGQPRFLTLSCYQRLPLFQNHLIKDRFAERIALSRARSRFKLLAWAIMPEHIHMVIIPNLPEWPLSKVLPVLKRRFAEQVIQRWIDLRAPILARVRTSENRYRFWQHGGGYDRNSRNEIEVCEKIEYCHWNPVRRGLAANPLDWHWSSARWYAGDRVGQNPNRFVDVKSCKAADIMCARHDSPFGTSRGTVAQRTCFCRTTTLQAARKPSRGLSGRPPMPAGGGFATTRRSAG